MKIQTGIDLVEDKRILKNLNNKNFLLKIFHPSELNYAYQTKKKEQAKKLAGIFALKEAASKALNLTPPRWVDIEVAYTSQGKPQFCLSSALLKTIKEKIISQDCSISHSKGLTAGIIIILVK